MSNSTESQAKRGIGTVNFRCSAHEHAQFMVYVEQAGLPIAPVLQAFIYEYLVKHNAAQNVPAPKVRIDQVELERFLLAFGTNSPMCRPTFGGEDATFKFHVNAALKDELVRMCEQVDRMPSQLLRGWMVWTAQTRPTFVRAG